MPFFDDKIKKTYKGWLRPDQPLKNDLKKKLTGKSLKIKGLDCQGLDCQGGRKCHY